jgi:hypothetical protein
MLFLRFNIPVRDFHQICSNQSELYRHKHEGNTQKTESKHTYLNKFWRLKVQNRFFYRIDFYPFVNRSHKGIYNARCLGKVLR